MARLVIPVNKSEHSCDPQRWSPVIHRDAVFPPEQIATPLRSVTASEWNQFFDQIDQCLYVPARQGVVWCFLLNILSFIGLAIIIANLFVHIGSILYAVGLSLTLADLLLNQVIVTWQVNRLAERLQYICNQFLATLNNDTNNENDTNMVVEKQLMACACMGQFDLSIAISTDDGDDRTQASEELSMA